MKGYVKYFILAMIGLWLLGFFYMLRHSSTALGGGGGAQAQGQLDELQQLQYHHRQQGFVDYNDMMKKKNDKQQQQQRHQQLAGIAEGPFVLDNGGDGQMSDVWIRRLKQAESELQRLAELNANNEAIIQKLQ
jgi:uncharacterized protein with NRDE domain